LILVFIQESTTNTTITMNTESIFKYELLDWIDENNLDFGYLSMNPNAIDLLKKNVEKIDTINKH
jgi:hypothetical protein